jgi:hypothetical protein
LEHLGNGAWERLGVEKEEVTCLKKSNQKTFGPAGACPADAGARRSESFFASFFSKKEVLPALP